MSYSVSGTSRHKKKCGVCLFFFLFSSGSALDIKGYIKERMDS